jgi:hypothetical protein
MQPILLNYSQHLQSVLPVIYWSDFEKLATGLNLTAQQVCLLLSALIEWIV